VSGAAALPPGIVVLERGWLSSNNVVVLGSDSAALVDSGYVTHAAQTLTLVERACEGRPLATLASTHLHSDHCGGNAALQERYPSCRTLIPPGHAWAVRAWDAVALTYLPTGQSCPRFRHDDVLAPGSSVRLGDLAWEVHAAPGHDPHSVVLFEPASRTLLSADALWENGFGVVFPELEGEDAFDDLGRTLDLIETLRPRMVVPGHGGVFSDVEGALGRARGRLTAYQADPRRHVMHAAKVLLKFKLLEWQQVSREACVQWAEETPYFGMVHSRFQPGVALKTWIEQLLADLARSGALRVEGDEILNV
jgi:glyoxylase-like metal-dependent hydrolase (beta-lactamase superfamily II)